jgi:hypothetical protein
MVATRRRYFLSGESDDDEEHNIRDDVESGFDNNLPRERFRDLLDVAIDRRRGLEIKRKLREAIESDRLERYRKSNEELKQIKNKKLKKFYEQQNERLDDWLEIDTLIMSVADDVLDSMNPRDMDHDGVAETGGALQGTGENIEPLLPDDERQRRRRARRNARWAINVSPSVRDVTTLQFAD